MKWLNFDSDLIVYYTKGKGLVLLGIHRWPVNSPYKEPVTRKNISSSWRHHVDSIYNNEEIIQLIFCAIRAQHAKKKMNSFLEYILLEMKTHKLSKYIAKLYDQANVLG